VQVLFSTQGAFMTYLVTGGAGFIGSNIVETLLRKGEKVRILDDFSTGKRGNLSFDVKTAVEVIEGDIRDLETCRRAVKNVRYVLHHAALGSVPRSVEDPLTTHEINVQGTLNMLLASRDGGVHRFVYASSSSVYGDQDGEGVVAGDPEAVSPKTERMKPDPLSPYAASKLAGELYCRLFCSLYGLGTVSLRYFNVFGKRQDPESEYAAVIPRFIQALLMGTPPVIYGDGKQSRDFTHVDDVVRANLMVFSAPGECLGGVFNIACGRRYSLLELLGELQAHVGKRVEPTFSDARKGDIRHSMADVSLARTMLGFEPETSFRRGLEKTVQWYLEKMNR
jgi:nucleoside-diphosphate-sugar epimerase